MSRGPSRPKKPQSRPAKASKPQTKAAKAGKPQAKPAKASKPRAKSTWGWQPDGRYIPLTDDGKVPEHLPDHLELFWRNRAEEWRRLYVALGRHVERLRAKLVELGFDPDTV